MEDLALRLMEKRKYDFDLPEPEIILDLRGGPRGDHPGRRTLAHRIIEEFMLAANEAVACSIEEHNVPSLYRVHEAPDLAKLNELATSRFWLRIPDHR